MPQFLSLGGKIKRIAGLVDTKQVSDAENQFLKRVIEQTREGFDTLELDGTQVDWVEDIFDKHFALKRSQ